MISVITVKGLKRVTTVKGTVANVRENGGKGRLIRELVMGCERLVR